jgi:lantibiotic biosynthesis protein
VAAFLAGAQAAGVSGAAALLADVLRWLRGIERPDARHRFPKWGGDVRHVDSRDAWCAGDLGIAASLVRVARATADRPLEAWALDVVRTAVAHPGAEVVTDASLCHGAASRAHILARLHQVTGDVALREHARTWYRQTLEWWRDADALVGLGLQLGVVGVGLVLLAGVSPVPPSWDEVLLLPG